MSENDFEKFSKRDFAYSIISILLTLLLSVGNVFPQIIDDALVEGSVLRDARFAITEHALESIKNEETKSIITIGSSILQYATDGGCISNRLNNDEYRVYNLAMSGANPYTEMLQIPKLIESKPSMVLLDLGPNALWDFYESKQLDEYIELRFSILSMSMSYTSSESWQPLIRESDKEYIADSPQKRINLSTTYSQSVVDDLIKRNLGHHFDIDAKKNVIPKIGSEEWISYLQTPNFLGPYFETLTEKEIEDWFAENMPGKSKQGVYNPLKNGTLNHLALEYIISQLTNSGIKVLMVSAPHHPFVHDFLIPGQIDGHNSTLNYFSQKFGAIPVNWFWEEWNPNYFRDRNHLGEAGRTYYCERIAEEIMINLE